MGSRPAILEENAWEKFRPQKRMTHTSLLVCAVINFALVATHTSLLLLVSVNPCHESIIASFNFQNLSLLNCRLQCFPGGEHQSTGVHHAFVLMSPQTRRTWWTENRKSKAGTHEH